MPHQCLKCGRIFEEGSPQLLRGCPDCTGNRFFYTKEPLDKKQREEINIEVGNDINDTILNILSGEDKEAIDKSGKWIKVNPKKIRKALEKHISENKIESTEKEDIDEITDDNHRKILIEKIKAEADVSENPETIKIEKPGKYNIDVKGLLEEEPIIIQKDGSYTIHLPSIFKMIDKEKEHN
jgi:predicted  nucleic acid-binding Zn-ribbon protein